jgi:hypothetical protein
MSNTGSKRNANTVWGWDFETIRKVISSEKDVRGVSFNEIENQTGVGFGQIAGFVKGANGLGNDSLASLIRWANLDPRQVIVRRRNATKHYVSPQERDLRILAQYMEAAGLKRDADESIVDAAVRLLAQAKEVDAFEGDQ